MGEVPQHAQPVVDADDDDAVCRKPRAVIHPFLAGAALQGAAVDPKKHGRMRGCLGGPDIQGEAVFARGPKIVRIDTVAWRWWLSTGGTELRRLPDAGPSWQFRRWFPASLPHRRNRVRDAFEAANGAIAHALEGARRRVQDRTFGRRSLRCAGARIG